MDTVKQHALQLEDLSLRPRTHRKKLGMVVHELHVYNTSPRKAEKDRSLGPTRQPA